MRNFKAIMLAIVALPVWAHAQTFGICDKKPQVRDAIMQALGAEGGLFIPFERGGRGAASVSLGFAGTLFGCAVRRGAGDASNGWLVRIDRQRLFRTIHGVAEQGSGRLLLNLADGPEFDVVVERTQRTLSGHSLSGRVEGVAGSAVTMVAHAGSVSFVASANASFSRGTKFG